ncbi:hypothetical protein Athai_31340 [Actinocatenispora thailandica]|uniref:WXG100 family type VII secretion target n=1 Tax=Actinocatenispora thailandica TaxID=227318 RepID=A0A7R7HXD9_9ACTN|nr:WXG100 family type VII secretion target [Actinocatenispora thailandica]BCJ35631.1 hypothetical protein Athai_31340 [Actinocatenispora thailandica]
MSENPSGSLWVNPEGVTKVGNAYQQQIALYETHLHRLESLRERYRSAWGDDSMGKQFQEQFDPLIDTLKGMITGVIGTLEFTAKGLRTAGESYRRADEDAATGSRKLNAEFSRALVPSDPPASIEGSEAEKVRLADRVELTPLRKTESVPASWRAAEPPHALEARRAELRSREHVVRREQGETIEGTVHPLEPTVSFRRDRESLLPLRATRSTVFVRNTRAPEGESVLGREPSRLRYGVRIPERPVLALRPGVLLSREAPHSELPERVAFRPAELDVVRSRSIEGEPTQAETFRRLVEPIPGEPRD